MTTPDPTRAGRASRVGRNGVILFGLMRKELLALRRDLHGLAALFLMPLMFIVLMSLALQNFWEPPRPPSRYAVLDHDGGAPARALLQRWQARHGAAQPLPADWQGAVRQGRLGYVLEVQSGFSARVAELIDGAAPRPARLVLHAEPGLDAAVLLVTQAELERSVGNLRARALLSELAPSALGGMGAGAEDGVADFVTVQRVGALVRPNAVQHNVPAWLVFGMFFVVAALGSLFVEERRCGALARLRGMGVGPGLLLAAKALPYLGVNLLQAALMLAVGLWLMPLLGSPGLSLQGVDLTALAVVLLAISAAAVGLGLALASLMRTSGQALAIGPLVNVLMAAAGGIMVPTFIMPAPMQALAQASPMNWALEALLTVLLRGGSLPQVQPLLWPLLALAAAALAVAAWGLQRRSPLE
jgi:ABC-2 type transport system permease protein